MNVLDRKIQRLMLHMMCRGFGINDISEVTGHSPNTVRRYLARFGEGLAFLHDRMVRHVSVQYLQCDETWSMVYARRTENIDPWSKRAPEDAGEFYTWTAMCRDTKLFVGWHIGDRSMETGRTFFKDLANRIDGRVQITTDGYPAYPEIIDDTFGVRADHVVLTKQTDGTWSRETGDSELRIFGIRKKSMRQTPTDLTLATTSMVERLHASMRNLNGRCVRKTYGFSKKLANHVHAQAIFGAYYNFGRSHGGFKGSERHFTPAIKARITSKFWTMDDLLDEVDAYWSTKLSRASLALIQPPSLPAFLPLPIGVASTKPYYVMYSPKRHDAKIHKGTCRNCRHGIGRADGAGLNQWFDFDTVEEALRCAIAVAPHHFSECAMCMKGYYAKTRRRM